MTVYCNAPKAPRQARRESDTSEMWDLLATLRFQLLRGDSLGSNT